MNLKKSNIITTVIFCVLIGTLTVASMVNPVREYSETENRNLAQMPKFTFGGLFNGTFTMDYEEFITDQFVMRDKWITVKNYAELALGKKESGGVYFGKDGYFIEDHELDSKLMETNIGYLKKFLSLASDKYNTRVLIAPTASLILQDKLPAYAPVWDQDELLDRVAELGNFVDTREILLEMAKLWEMDSTLTSYAGEGDQLYYRTDHHWTTTGAYYAYTELCKSLGIEPFEYGDFTRTVLSDEFYGTLAAKVNMPTEPDILYTLDTDLPLTVTYNGGAKVTDTLYEKRHLDTRSKYSVFLDENQPMVEIITGNKNGKTLLMIKDSYAHCMVPMLVNHYERVVLFDLRGLTGGVFTNFIPMIEKAGEIDDIVILYNAENFTEDKNLIKLVK